MGGGAQALFLALVLGLEKVWPVENRTGKKFFGKNLGEKSRQKPVGKILQGKNRQNENLIHATQKSCFSKPIASFGKHNSNEFSAFGLF